ncbi:PD-(D/E)XK nuclease family protein [Corynebacterium sp. CCUG 69979]|nr:PD-(D/E)XK nuclease family protein [Corynebacterium sp. CCUG 69979]
MTTMDGFLRNAARALTPRTALPKGRILREVSRVLLDEDTAFKEKSLHTESATRSSLSNIVARLLALPPESRRLASSGLPGESARIAECVAQRIAAEHFTVAENHDEAVRQNTDVKVIAVGNVARTPQEERLLERIDATYVDPAVANSDKVPVTAYRDPCEEIADVVSLIRENKSADPNTRVAVATCDPGYVPELATTLTAAGIGITAPSHKALKDDPYVRAILQVLALDARRFPRRDVSELLGTAWLEGLPSQYSYDRLTRGRREEEETAQWAKDFQEQLQRVWASQTWEETSQALKALLGTTTPAVDAVIDDLATLDNHLPPPTQEMVYDLVNDAFSGLQRFEPTGDVVIGDLSDIVGMQLDHLYIVGATDTNLPGTFTEDPAIKAAQSGVDSVWLNKRMTTLWEAALRSADNVAISYPRSSVMGDISGEPSSWILEQQPARRFDSGTLVPPTDKHLAVLKAAVDTEETPFTRVRGYRETGQRNAYNGFIHSPIGQRYLRNPLSPTSMEKFSDEPQQFFVEKVLQRSLLDDKPPATSVDSAERGTIFHEIFEEWALENRLGPNLGADMNEEKWRASMAAIVDKHVGDAREYSPMVWQAFASEVRSQTKAWLEREIQDSQDGWIAVGAEVNFGDAAPFKIDLGNGATIFVHGSIDRVDVRGDEVRVTDYKSGKSKTYIDKLKANQFIGGPRDHVEGKGGYVLQLAVYGEVVHGVLEGQRDAAPELAAVLDRFLEPGEGATVNSRYWMFRDEAQQEVDVAVNEEARKVLREYLREAHRAITAGEFPPTYSKKNHMFGYSSYAVAFGPNRNNAVALAVAETELDQ